MSRKKGQREFFSGLLCLFYLLLVSICLRKVCIMIRFRLSSNVFSQLHCGRLGTYVLPHAQHYGQEQLRNTKPTHYYAKRDYYKRDVHCTSCKPRNLSSLLYISEHWSRDIENAEIISFKRYNFKNDIKRCYLNEYHFIVTINDFLFECVQYRISAFRHWSGIGFLKTSSLHCSSWLVSSCATQSVLYKREGKAKILTIIADIV